MRRGCPAPDPRCKYAQNGGCFADEHHLYFPKDNYRTKLERQFRELYTVSICRRMHDELHAVTQPPPKPNADQMRKALQMFGKRRRGRK